MKKTGGFHRVAALLCAVSMTVFCFSGCAEHYDEYTSFAMGSVLNARLFGDDSEENGKLFEDISAAVSEADRCLSATKEDSDINRLNLNGRAQVSEYTLSVLMDSIMLCNILDKTTDITMGGVTELWGFSGEHPALPADEDIQKALSYVGLEQVEVDKEHGTVSLGEGQKIDLGAFGKGAACDAIFDVISGRQTKAVIDFGGNIMVYGEGPSDGSWKIGIRNPFSDAGDYFAVAEVNPTEPKYAAFVSTSGSYEKTFEENGKTYHHILSTKTGYPVESELAAVTVISSSGINSDALSTACFINGLNEDTLSWLKNFGAQGVFVFSDGTYYITEGLTDSFTLEDSSFRPVELS